jgi:hypothetical protein
MDTETDKWAIPYAGMECYHKDGKGCGCPDNNFLPHKKVCGPVTAVWRISNGELLATCDEHGGCWMFGDGDEQLW